MVTKRESGLGHESFNKLIIKTTSFRKQKLEMDDK